MALGLTLTFNEPGKPVQNAFLESFNGTMRNECLNEHRFLDLEGAKELIETWRLDYNSQRPHSTLAGMTAGKFALAAQTPIGNLRSSASACAPPGQRDHPKSTNQPNGHRLVSNNKCFGD